MLKQNSNVMQIFVFLLSALLLQLETSSFVFALNNGLARTPPMGWLAWERFKCNINCSKNMEHCISERLFMQMADRLVADGFRDAGYVYVNIDDCWMAPKRDTQGKLVADPKRFPRGIKFLADYMHSRGLKLGIYQDYGKYTCMGYPGIIGHMEQDANSFAEWEVDMVKLDACHSDPKDLDEGYVTMGRYLNQTKRPMVYSCSWPYYQLVNGMEPNYKLIAKYCNLWRNFDDIQDSWVSIQKTIDFFGDNQEVLIPHVGPGQWSDPDMLVFGNFLLTYDQARIQMAVWAMIAAPLLMSNDLRTLAPKFRNILLNRHIIAVNQDPIGIPGRRIYKKDGIEVWKRPITPVLKNQRSYVLLFLSRRSASKPVFVTFQLKQFSLKNPSGYFLTELFSGDNYGAVTTNQSIKIELSAIDLVMLKAKILNLHEHQNFINIK